MTRPRVRHIGSDRVVLDDDRLVVISRVNMEDWDVRRHRAAVIDYTTDYVARRDESRAVGRRRGRVTVGLRILSPLVGFLSARAKGRLEAVYGMDPVASTFQSVFLEFLITLAALTLASVGAISRSIPVAPALAIAVLAAVDGVVRWERILNEERPPPGFYEWLVARRR